MAEGLARAQPRYDEAKARRYLTWLAREMQQRGVTVFMIEDLQPACLARWVPFLAYVVASRLLATVAVAVPTMIVGWAQSWSGSTLLGMLAWTLAASPGLVLLCLFDLRWTATSRAGRALRLVLFSGLVGGGAALVAWLNDGDAGSLIWGAVMFGLLGAVMAAGRPRRPTDDIHVVESLSWSWRRGLLSVAAGLVLIVWAVIGTWEGRGGKLDLSDLFVGAAFLAAVLLALTGFRPGLPGLKASPNQGILATARHSVRVGLGVFAVAAVPFFLLDASILGVTWLDPFPTTSAKDLIAPAVFVAATAMVLMGGKEVIRHVCLRLVLWVTGALPWRLARFLDHASVQLQILQKVGGGYIFVHRLLLEHFAGDGPRRAGLVLGAVTALFVSLLWAAPQAARPEPGAAPSRAARAGTLAAAALAHGDLIFRSGTSLDSRLIRVVDRASRYSHVGMVDLSDGVVHVVHIEPGNDDVDGHVRREPLRDFLGDEKASGYAVYRVSGADDGRAAAAVRAALDYQAAGVTFDRRFDLETPATMYCTELVWRAYLAAGLDLTRGDLQGTFPLGPQRAVRLSSLLRSPHVSLIVEGGR